MIEMKNMFVGALRKVWGWGWRHRKFNSQRAIQKITTSSKFPASPRSILSVLHFTR
jgi:hypothetical protein